MGVETPERDPGRQRLRRAVAQAQGGSAPDHGPRDLRRGHHAPRHAARGARAVLGGAREDHVDRRDGGARAARRRWRCSRARTWPTWPRRARWCGSRRGSTSTCPSTGRWRAARSATSARRSRWSWPRSASLAFDAAEQVLVEYDPLPVILDPEAALEDGAPIIHEDHGSNKVFEWSLEGGDAEAALADSDVVIERRVVNHRTAGGAIEPRGTVAEWREGKLTMWSATQIPHIARVILSIQLGLSEEKIRVVAPEVGGGFGSKLQVYGEEVLACWCARKLGRPVKWIADPLGRHGDDPPRARPDRLRAARRQARRDPDRDPRRRSSRTAAPTT